METRSIPPTADVALATSTMRQTPTPPRAARFGEVLSSTVVHSAESVMRSLPGSPVMAVAIRSATGVGTLGIPATNLATSPLPQGPSPSLAPAGTTAGGFVDPLAAAGGTAGTAGTGTGTGIEASLQQSQDMNLYFLQIQETVNQQNRSYTTLSNVLKAEHDTVKNAIGNIR
jgi:hypothetical protein